MITGGGNVRTVDESVLGQRVNPRLLAVKCPHCDTYARTNARKVLTPVYEERYFQCPNLLCGHTWKAGISFLCTISPSAMERTELALPLSERSKPALPRPANDPVMPPLPPAANDGSETDDSTQTG